MKTSWTGQPVLSFVKEGGPFAKKKEDIFWLFWLWFA